MINATCEAVIREYCRELKLAAVVRVYQGLCRRARVTAAGPTRIFCANCSRPRSPTAIKAPRADCCARRGSRTLRRSIRSTGLHSGISRPKLLELSNSEFIGRAEDVILAGPIGTGKTHLAYASALRPRVRPGAEPDRGARPTPAHRAAAALSKSRTFGRG